MSIAYNLFGIPRTFNEFVDKIRKKGYTRVNVIVESCRRAGPGIEVFKTYYRIGIQSGNIRLKKLNRYYEHIGLLGMDEVEQEVWTEARRAAEKLQNLGLEATINNGPIAKG